jgi:hypothetical protein
VPSSQGDTKLSGKSCRTNFQVGGGHKKPSPWGEGLGEGGREPIPQGQLVAPKSEEGGRVAWPRTPQFAIRNCHGSFPVFILGWTIAGMNFQPRMDTDKYGFVKPVGLASL